MSSPPKWAQNLVRRVWLDAGRSIETLPELAWRSGNDPSSSGKACPCCNRILVAAGTDRADAKLVLLHECGHLLTRQGHTAAFWDTVWQLYRRHRVPIRYALEREGSYRKGAVKAYARTRGRRSRPVRARRMTDAG